MRSHALVDSLVMYINKNKPYRTKYEETRIFFKHKRVNILSESKFLGK